MAEFGKFMMSKPFVTFPSAIVLIVGIGVMINLGRKTENLSEIIELFFQKMAPALNETSGFLLISYAVILCIGNVIMKTSPKYLASGEESQEDKTTGFVGWLQSKGLGWLPIFISATVVTLMTFLPINNKMLKIGMIAIILGGVLVAALFFNAIIKLFAPKEEFTNVKEEFGHMVEKKQHNLKITVQVKDKGDSDLGYGSYFIDIKNDSGGDATIDGHNQDWRSVEGMISTYNGIELGTDATYEPYIDLDAVYNSDKYDVYYSTEVANKPGFLTSLKKLTDKTKQIDVTEIEEQTYYFHLFPKDIKIFSGDPSPGKFVLGTGYTTNENGICTLGGKEPLAGGDEVFIFPPGGIKYDHPTNKYRYKFDTTGAIKHIDWTGDGTATDKNKLVDAQKVNVDVILFTENTLKKSPQTSTKFSIKNMQKFFGFDVDVVKDSVRASYTAYYALVWGSLIGYIFYNWKQLWYNKEFVMKIAPFLVAVLIETLLIAQSHSSLNESDVASSSGQASPTFNYAIAGFSTRVATVVAFLSTIITNVEEG